MPPEPTTPKPSTLLAPMGLTQLLIAGVRGYQLALSPALHALAGPGCGCRFTPSCSHYAIEALSLHGPIRGTTLTARRLLRCQPWGASGIDLVPPRNTRTA